MSRLSQHETFKLRKYHVQNHTVAMMDFQDSQPHRCDVLHSPVADPTTWQVALGVTDVIVTSTPVFVLTLAVRATQSASEHCCLVGGCRSTVTVGGCLTVAEADCWTDLGHEGSWVTLRLTLKPESGRVPLQTTEITPVLTAGQGVSVAATETQQRCRGT